MNVDPLEAIEERIRATFARLSSLGPLEQETILTDISAADPDVSRAVARLLGLSAPPAFAAGDLISDRFRIVGLLGKGGMGEVYEADDAVLRERVALKTLPAEIATDARAVERLKREIALARRVTHPNVCRVFDVDQDRAPSGAVVTFFTMELLAGPTLSERLKTRGRMTAAEALPMLRRMADGLGAAHAAGVVHGDFKPGNVMLAATAGSSERLVVTDFGLALPAHPALLGALAVTVGAGGGTPMYMAPEQIARNPLTPQTDVYALGVVAKEMVAGELDTRWRSAIARCLEHEPSARFATAADFVNALESRADRSILWPAIAASAAVLVAAAVIAWRLPMFRTPPASPPATVALLPLVSAQQSPDASAMGDGLAVTLADGLRLAAELQHLDKTLLVLPAAEVIEAGLTTAASAQRTLGAGRVISGRLNHDAAGTTVTMQIAPADHAETSQVVSTTTATRVAMPDLLARVTKLAGLPLRVETAAAIGEGWTKQPAAEVLYLQGRGYLARHGAALPRAADALRRAVELDSGYAQAHIALGDAYRQQYIATPDPALLAKAQASAERGLALAPSLPYAHVILGLVYKSTGQYERVLRELETALAVDPGAVDASRGIAEVFEQQGDNAKAEATYRRQIAQYPQYWNAHEQLGSFLVRRGRYGEAEISLLSGVQYAPDNTRAIGNLAGVYALTERYAAAEGEVKRGLQLERDVLGLNNLSFIYVFQGRFADAVVPMEQAVRLPGANSFHWGNLARVYRWAHLSEQANATYVRAERLAREEVAADPKIAKNRATLAQILAETGRRNDALAEITATLKFAPDDMRVVFTSALVYELTGDRAAALAALEKAARGGHSPAEIRRHPDLARLRQDPRYVPIMAMASASPVK
jgi:tetratricopeptide (TPR) repeat protein/tRNA A-37 threonylcarbamoyl transferase component Bud32